MFNVVFEALVRRHNRAAVEASASANPPSSFRLRPPSLRAGVIPAGSTDVAGHTLHGTSDQTSIALRVAMGEQRGLDALAVFVGGRFRCLSVTVASRGFFGDNLAWSEEMRWMGPTRYEAAGLMNLLKNKSFKGDLHTVYSTILCAAQKRCFWLVLPQVVLLFFTFATVVAFFLPLLLSAFSTVNFATVVVVVVVAAAIVAFSDAIIAVGSVLAAAAIVAFAAAIIAIGSVAAANKIASTF